MLFISILLAVHPGSRMGMEEKAVGAISHISKANEGTHSRRWWR
jgi:hypothetical protein